MDRPDKPAPEEPAGAATHEEAPRPAAPRGGAARLTQAAALIVIFGVVLLLTRLLPDADSVVGPIAGVGFLLLAGTLTSELAEVFRLPHLSSYLIVGAIAGPHVLHLVDAPTVGRLSSINPLVLSLLALAGGVELRFSLLRGAARSLAYATLFQTTSVFVACSVAFWLLAPLMPFTGALGGPQIFGVAVLWGVIAVSRSPAALMGILSETQASGPLARFSLAFVMLSDVLVVVMLAVVIAGVRSLFDPDMKMTFADVGTLGHEILGSLSLGMTVGIFLVAYLRFVRGQLLGVLLVLGVGLSELLRYIQFDPVLAFLVAGVVVSNFSEQGPKLLDAVRGTNSVIFVIFFTVAGAQLELPILRALGPIALALTFVRAVVTWLAARLTSRVANDTPLIQRWGFSSMISQAGLTLGLATIIVRAFPSLGGGFLSLIIANVAINELFGPIIFKVALDRAGETRAH